MIIKERNLDGEVVEREIETVDELKHQIIELEQKIMNLEMTLSLVTAKELSAIPTTDLMFELGYRFNEADKKAKNFDKLDIKHKKSADLIAELKHKNEKYRQALSDAGLNVKIIEGDV